MVIEQKVAAGWLISSRPSLAGAVIALPFSSRPSRMKSALALPCAAVRSPRRGRGGVRSLGALDLQAPRGGAQGADQHSWIAATAIAHGVPIVTRDSDYDAIPDLDVIRI